MPAAAKLRKAASNKAKPVRQPGRAITLDEARHLLAACGRGPAGMRNAAFVALGFGAGLRCSEALAVLPRHLERRADGVLVQVVSGKGNKSRLVALLPEFLAPIDRWLEARKRLGITAAAPIVCGITSSQQENALGGTRGTKGAAISAAAMRATIKRLASKAAISQRVHCHGLRHGHASTLAGAGAELRAISGQLGHQSTATTDRYLARLDPRHLLAAVAKVAH